MAFSSTYNGDIIRTGYVLPVLVAHSIMIPGLTEPENMVIQGESCYWKEFTGATVTDGAYGRELSTTNAGFTRHAIDLSQSIGLCNLVSGADIKTNFENAAGVAAQEMTMKAVKQHNVKALAAMKTGGTTLTSTVALTASTAFEAIVDAVAKYAEDNKAYGDEATACIISQTVKANLIKQIGEKAFTAGSTNILFDGYLGDLAGVKILVSNDLPANTEFILVGKNSFLAPYDVTDLQIIENVPGHVSAVQLQAEMPYGFGVTKASRILVKNKAA